MSFSNQTYNLVYSNLFKEGTIIGDYVRFMQQYETATIFDVFGAFSLLSLIMGRDVYVDRPGSPVYLNTFFLYCAESGVARKTTAINHVRAIYDLYRQRTISEVSVFSARANMEAIVKELGTQSALYGTANAAFLVPELANFLGTKSYLADLPALLTELYDCPESTTGLATSKAGVLELSKVWASFLAACAPSWLVQAINPSVMEGGFASRLLIIREYRSKRAIPWPVSEILVDKFRADLVDRLIALKADSVYVNGKIGLTEGAIKAYSRWYKNRKLVGGYYLGAFESREADHVLRLAALISINDDSWVINQCNITVAIRLVHNRKVDGYKTFVTLANQATDATKATHRPRQAKSGNDNLLSVIISLRDHFIRRGGSFTSQSFLTAKFKGMMNAKGVLNVLSVMQDHRMVQHYIQGAKGRGRPGRYWRGTSLLTQLVPEELAEKIDVSRAA